MNTVAAKGLQPCDVLLYHGTELISRLIRLFDGGQFSHSSIYAVDGYVLEATGEGTKQQEIKNSIAKAAYVKVYRFIGDAGQALDPGGLPNAPILSRIAYYQQNPQRYAYEQVMLLAVLIATRRLPVIGWVPGLGRLLRTFLDSAADCLTQLIAAGREPMLCSELVYRCFQEAGAAYKLKIRGADILKAASLGLQPGALPLILATPVTGDEAQAAREQEDLRIAAADLLSKYALAKSLNNPPSAVAPLAVADFVTPRDLETSPNLICVGTLQL